MKPKKKQLIGTTDYIDLPQLEVIDVACKIDTGAQTSSLNCSAIHLKVDNEVPTLCFKLYAPKFGINNKTEFQFTDFKQRTVRSSNGQQETRYTIKTAVVIFKRKIKTEFTLSFRQEMKYPILLGKRFLRHRFIVDVAQKDLNKNFKIDA